MTRSRYEVRKAGFQALNDALRPTDAARAFIALYFGGTGDDTAGKYERPDIMEVEFYGFMERAKAEAGGLHNFCDSLEIKKLTLNPNLSKFYVISIGYHWPKFLK